MIVALVVGTVLAIGALAFVLQPLFFRAAPRVDAPPPIETGGESDRAIAALREIEFDRAMGKLSEIDYAQLKARYTREAVLEMRREQAPAELSAAPSDDELESVVSAYRARPASCPVCGPRPEPDAAFCSNCGRSVSRDRGARIGDRR
jgi:hypothetical protein